MAEKILLCSRSENSQLRFHTGLIRIKVMGLRRAAINKITAKLLRHQNTFTPRPRLDCFLASYPRSGNTWIRAVAFYLEMERKPDSLAEIDRQIIDLHYKPKMSQLLAKRERYIVKTHHPQHGDIQKFLYVTRNPTEAILSYYNFVRQSRGYNETVEDFAKSVTRGSYWPCSWQEHVRSWVGSQPINTNHLIRYEDLIDPQRRPSCIAKIADAFEYPNHHEVAAAFNLFDLNEMQRLEKLGNRPSLSQSNASWFIGGDSLIPKEEAKATIARVIKAGSSDAMAICEELGYQL